MSIYMFPSKSNFQLEVAVKSYSEHSFKRHCSLNIVFALAIALSQVQEQDRV
jgi:hypothetical protein